MLGPISWSSMCGTTPRFSEWPTDLVASLRSIPLEFIYPPEAACDGHYLRIKCLRDTIKSFRIQIQIILQHGISQAHEVPDRLRVDVQPLNCGGEGVFCLTFVVRLHVRPALRACDLRRHYPLRFLSGSVRIAVSRSFSVSHTLSIIGDVNKVSSRHLSEETSVSQVSPTASTGQWHARGSTPEGTSQTTPPPTAQSSQTQQSPEVKAKLASIYAEAEQEHWSESQTNQAITKALEQSGTSSTSASTNEGTSLIDVSA
jgi:hypothetical protein